MTLHWGPHGGKFVLWDGSDPIAAWHASAWSLIAEQIGRSISMTGEARVDGTRQVSLSHDEALRFVADFLVFARGEQ